MHKTVVRLAMQGDSKYGFLRISEYFKDDMPKIKASFKKIAMATGVLHIYSEGDDLIRVWGATHESVSAALDELLILID